MFQKCCLWHAIFFIILTLYNPYATAQTKHYINGIDANYPPFSFIDEYGNPTGFDIESMDWIAQTMGFTVEHRPIDWDGILPALLKKKIDMICSGMTVSPERAHVVLFTKPYWETETVLVVHKNSTLTVDEIYTNKGIRLGIQRGTNQAEELQNNAQQKNYTYTLVFYESTTLAIEDLIHKRIHALAIDDTLANNALQHGKPIKKIGAISKNNFFAVAVRKNDKELAKNIEEGYQRLQKEPFWQELQKKYINYSQP